MALLSNYINTTTANGNFGIGTGIPTERLTVFGNTLTTGSLSASQNIIATGNVGIGTGTPGAKLEIVGSVAETKSTPSITSNTLTLNAATGALFVVSLNSDITSAISVTNVPSSPKMYTFMLQFTFPDNTARTVTWPTNTRWSSGVAPTLTCIVDKADTFSFLTHDGGSNWYGFVVGQNQ